MTERVRKLKEIALHRPYVLCMDKMRIAFPVLEAMKGQSSTRTRAQIHAEVLRKIPIFIEEGDLIAGAGASRPNGMEMEYEYGPWSEDEVRMLKEEGYQISAEDEAQLADFMERFGAGDLAKSKVGRMGEILTGDEKMWRFMKSGVTLPPWKDKRAGSGGGKAQSGIGMGPGEYLMVIDFEKILTRGARAVIEECREKLASARFLSEDAVEKKEFWESVILVYEAWIDFARRYADLAEEMAEEEKDVKRAAELEEMARICRRVPEYPATSFKEAVQSFWFTFLLTVPSPTASAGRFDQYMYPFYEQDIRAGLITREEALEYLELIRIKDYQLNRVSGKANRAKNAGMAKWHNFTIGGVDADGNDATNEISWLILEAAQEVRLPHHTISIRVHEGSPLEFLTRGVELVRDGGLGMPAFMGDRSQIGFLMRRGLDERTARNYAISGCIDGVVPAVTRTGPNPMFVIALVFDIFMHNGFCPATAEEVGIRTGEVTSFETFEEFKTAFYQQLDYFCGLACEMYNVESLVDREVAVDVFRSALMDGCIEEGKDIYRLHIKPFDGMNCYSAVGIVNVADSLTAIRKLVYEEKRYTMEQLVEALDANWAGYEQMRSDFKDAPKYGNDIDEADEMAADVFRAYAAALMQYPNANGGVNIANAISITAHQPGGLLVGALPDGRGAGEILADGSMSPNHGCDKNGPLAILKSALKVDQDEYQATLLNMKFHPSAIKTHEDAQKLAMMIRTYLVNGGKHIQFNVVTQETLVEAKVKPEEHEDLVVRVAGYSAYFTKLTEGIQNELIERTGHTSVG